MKVNGLELTEEQRDLMSWGLGPWRPRGPFCLLLTLSRFNTSTENLKRLKDEKRVYSWS